MENQNSNREIIQDIKSNIQFLVTAEILLAAIVYGLFKAQGASEAVSNSQNLAWYIGIAFSVFNYLAIGIAKIFKESLLKLVRFSISLAIFLFGTTILIVAIVQYKPLPGYFDPIFYTLIFGSLLMPIATFILIIFGMYWTMISDLWKRAKNRFRRKKL